MSVKPSKVEALLSVEEVAAWLNTSVYTVRRYIKAGRLKAKRMGKYYRIFPDSVRVFLASDMDASVSEER